jgi:outer membrane protein insertion porin family
MKKLLLAITLITICSSAWAQVNRPQLQIDRDSVSYLNAKDFIIADITVTGTQHLDKDVLITISKLIKGDRVTIPSEITSNVIKNLWAQGLFDDVKLFPTYKGDSVYFEIQVLERPRLSKLNIQGISKTQTDEIQKKLNDKTGKIVNENLRNTTTSVIKRHFAEKGFLNTEVTMQERSDASDSNSVILDVIVDKKSKVRVNSIVFEGNQEFKAAKLKKFLKKTREKRFYNVFGSKKFLADKYEEDKYLLISKMQDRGFRDAEVIKDSVWNHDDKTVNVKLNIYEGPKYYFGDIKFSGNAQYPAADLYRALRIKKGDVFSEEELNKRLNGSPNGDDVASIFYLNAGYLTYQADPVQTRIYGDTIDLDIRIYEGPQYTINNVIVRGNEITNDKVIRREIRTKPGQKFSKEAIVRSTREITALGNFDEQKTEPKPININSAEGTVDLLYNVAEKPSDQIELSGGFGGGQIIGTLGLTFNNFSLRNIFNLSAYKPLPKGDGQRLSLRGQANGKSYQNYSFTFSEPWFGGKKPINFGITAYTQLNSNGYFVNKNSDNYYKIRINGVGANLGRRLKFPDDYFTLNNSLNYDHYIITNYPGYIFNNGVSDNIRFTTELARNSLDGSPTFPTSGSNIRLTVQLTPPYSLFNNVNYGIATAADRYRFVEYHKWKFEAQWFQKIYGKLILKAQTQFGFLGQYNKAVGQSPFERFKLGGDGMQTQQFIQGVDIIGLRGYSNGTVIPDGANRSIAENSGSPIFAKYVMEVRHPIMNSQSANIFILGFAEAGNTWNRFNEFSPFNVRRSVGVGARIFLPIFGLLGLDYGYGFDRIPGSPDANKGQFHFSIAQSLGGGFN